MFPIHPGIDLVEEMKNGATEVKIDRIDPHGAANDDSTIEVCLSYKTFVSSFRI